jgi:hypothetical protein
MGRDEDSLQKSIAAEIDEIPNGVAIQIELLLN